jgi:hypothetical protein
MKTRRHVRNGNKTRKGGKTEKENYTNYKSVWETADYPYFDPKMNYPSRFESWIGKKPEPRQELHQGTDKNTYIIKRHGFSCANMLKEQGKFQQYMIPDPSLCSYGIFSLLRDKPKPEGFEGIVFVSSLIRTWQTAMLEYGSYGSLTLIVSPYIKEKDSHSFDSPNFPLPFSEQLAHMNQFMDFLKNIDSPVAKQILSHKHTVVRENEFRTFGRKQSEASENMYLDTIKWDVSQKEHAQEKEVETYAFIPSPKDIPEADYSKYYKAEGFLYFDAWIRKHYPTIKTVFVVSHSGFMQKIIKQFSVKTIETGIFKQNVWTLRISPKEETAPKHLKMNYKINIYPGLSKPNRSELENMNRRSEPLCNAIPEERTDPSVSSHSVRSEPSESPSDLSVSAHYVPSERPSEISESYHSVRSEPSERPSEMSESYHSTMSSLTANSEPRARSDSNATNISELSFLTEETPSRIKSTPVTTEKKDAILTRSFTELVTMLRDNKLESDLSEFIHSPKEFKTKAMQFVHSDPNVFIADPTQPKSIFKSRKKVPIYLFENHYLAFLLMDTAYFNSIIQKLEESNTRLIDAALAYFNIRSSTQTVIAFLKSLRNLIDQDTEFYQLLVQKFSVGANRHYYLKAVPYYFAFTLLDLLLYEFNPTMENIHLMYRFMIDLVKRGARFSETIYSQDGATKDWFEFPSSDIVPLSMPSVKVEPLGTEQKEHELTLQWDDAKRRLDPSNELSQLNKQYLALKRALNDEHDKLQSLYDNAKHQEAELARIHEYFLEKNSSLIGELEDVKQKYREAKLRIDPNNEFMKLRLAMRKTVHTGIYTYLNMHLADLIDSKEVEDAHNSILKKLLELPARSEPVVSIGGSRGTSWKRSSLRQSSVKAGRYRALRYKGKKRTRANRL